MNDPKAIDKKINRIAGPIALAFFIGWLIYGIYNSYQISHHFAFTTGRVTRVYLPQWGSSNYELIYKYKVNGEFYNGNSGYSLCDGQNKSQLGSLFLGKQFPVLSCR